MYIVTQENKVQKIKKSSIKKEVKDDRIEKWISHNNEVVCAMHQAHGLTDLIRINSKQNKLILTLKKDQVFDAGMAVIFLDTLMKNVDEDVEVAKIEGRLIKFEKFVRQNHEHVFAALTRIDEDPVLKTMDVEFVKDTIETFAVKIAKGL